MMNIRQVLTVFLILLNWYGLAQAQTTTFTYQGKLTDAGNPANGNFDLQFKLYDTATVGTGVQQGATLVRNPVAVSAGIFTVTLDFGANVFGGPDRYLEIGVRPQGSGNPYTVLTPRQPITSSPYAIQTLNAQQLGGIPASGFVQNTTTPQAGVNFNIGGMGTAGSLNILNTILLAGSGAPAVAPAGQTRLYFDSSANKLRVSENGGAYVNLVGATGVSGSGTANTIPLWSAGTTLGNSLVTQSGNSVNMPNSTIFGASASGHVAQFGSPNTETGLTFSGGGFRSDIRYNGTLKIVNGVSGGPPPATNGISINSSGNIGLGIDPATTGKLHVVGAAGQPAIYAETDNRAVWGKSTGSSYGVYGESGSGIGVQGLSTSNTGTVGQSTSGLGVFGNSTSNSGVRGDTASADVLFPGVRGISTGSGGVGVRGDGTTGVYGVSQAVGGIGVIGESNTGTGSGVYGIGKFGGTGVYGISSSGYAVYANGSAGQPRDKSGFVKAMLYVDPFQPSSAYIQRCYNGITNNSNGDCGFSMVRNDVGDYTIDFGFRVDDRFQSLTLNSVVIAGIPTGIGTTGSITLLGTNQIQIFMYSSNVGYRDCRFWLIVY